MFVFVRDIFFIHLSVDGHLGCSCVLAIVNNAEMNMGVKISLRDSDFISFRCIPRSEIVGPYGSSIFNFLRNLHTVFHNDCTNYIPTHSVQRFPFFLHPLQHLLLIIFIKAILTGMSDISLWF